MRQNERPEKAGRSKQRPYEGKIKNKTPGAAPIKYIGVQKSHKQRPYEGKAEQRERNGVLAR